MSRSSYIRKPRGRNSSALCCLRRQDRFPGRGVLIIRRAEVNLILSPLVIILSQPGETRISLVSWLHAFMGMFLEHGGGRAEGGVDIIMNNTICSV